MRNNDEMMKLILDRAKEDEAIRMAWIGGSRIDPNATHDKYCDYDIVYLVKDIGSFTNIEDWIDYFGERLIMQKPADWHDHPYDYNDNQNFTYLIQFKDGNRIDLTLIDIGNLQEVLDDTEPRRILLDKDGIYGLKDIEVNDYYNIKEPSEREFLDCCNEFWWLSVNVAKALCREELVFVKYLMEDYEREMFLMMLDWSIGIDNDFSVSTGKCYRYLKRYLSKEDMDKLIDIFPDGGYQNIWNKLYKMCNYFNDLALKVSKHFAYTYDIKEAEGVIKHIKNMEMERNN